MRASHIYLNETGAALLLALAAAALVTAIATSLIVSVCTETLISGSFRATQEVLYAADAGLALAIRDLAIASDWTPALAPSSSGLASFDDGVGMAVAPDGRRLAMAVLTMDRQRTSNRSNGADVFGLDSPVWRLFGHAPLAAILPPGLIAQPGYVLVWVADDGLDGDGDPARDANGQLLVFTEAYGVRGARRAIEASIARAGPGLVRLLTWKDTR